MATAEIGVFGGSGFYSFLDDVEQVEVETPYGAPSAPLFIGEIGGKRVAFLPRHGANHELPPHRIPYRANVWAMRELGVRRIIGPCASGALQADLQLGEFVVCDQFVDRTTGRADTFYDGPETTHVSAADPYCPDLRRLLVDTARRARHPGARRRDGRDHPGPALLDPRRVEVVPRRRLAHDQHDRLSRGLSRPRVRALLREHLDGHRPRRRRRGRGAGDARGGAEAFSPRTTSAFGSCSSRSFRRSGLSRRTSARPRCAARAS